MTKDEQENPNDENAGRGRTGSWFEDFPIEAGIADEVNAVAIKRVEEASPWDPGL